VSVRSSTTETSVMGWYAKRNSRGVRVGYRPRHASMLFFTTVESSAVPSWKLTPSRSLMVQTVRSSFDSTVSASNPTKSPSSLGTVSVS
jgi:hypothetical protein